MYGADAVYLGGEAFGLRAKAKNFTGEEIRQGIAYAHDHGVRVYVTANILAHNEDLDKAREYFQELREYGPDALIISDPGIFPLQGRRRRRLTFTSAPRPTIRITALTSFGMGWGQSGWCRQENCP